MGSEHVELADKYLPIMKAKRFLYDRLATSSVATNILKPLSIPFCSAIDKSQQHLLIFSVIYSENNLWECLESTPESLGKKLGHHPL